jgi:phosphoenolpyruvate phosphomutase
VLITDKRTLSQAPCQTVLGTPIFSFLQEGPRIGVGVHNGLSALLATKHAFDFLWVSSFESSAASGLPDAGLIDACEMAGVVRTVRRSSPLPIVVDMDAGYGDGTKVYHEVRAMAQAGAAAVCIEDAGSLGKRSSLYEGYERSLASVEEHSRRVRAARIASDEGSRCGVIARIEALVAGLGQEEAWRRALAYVEAGADAIFIHSVEPSGEDALAFCTEWKRRTPVFVAPTRYPRVSTEVLHAAGASHIIYANQGLRAAYKAIDSVFSRLRSASCPGAVEDAISSVAELSIQVGQERLRSLERQLDQVETDSLPAEGT